MVTNIVSPLWQMNGSATRVVEHGNPIALQRAKSLASLAAVAVQMSAPKIHIVTGGRRTWRRCGQYSASAHYHMLRYNRYRRLLENICFFSDCEVKDIDLTWHKSRNRPDAVEQTTSVKMMASVRLTPPSPAKPMLLGCGLLALSALSGPPPIR